MRDILVIAFEEGNIAGMVCAIFYSSSVGGLSFIAHKHLSGMWSEEML